MAGALVASAGILLLSHSHNQTRRESSSTVHARIRPRPSSARWLMTFGICFVVVDLLVDVEGVEARPMAEVARPRERACSRAVWRVMRRARCGGSEACLVGDGGVGGLLWAVSGCY